MGPGFEPGARLNFYNSEKGPVSEPENLPSNRVHHLRILDQTLEGLTQELGMTK